MRTNEQRTQLIHKRTAEIKREHRNRKQRSLEAVCMVTCMFFVIGIGAWMSERMADSTVGNSIYSTGAASMIASHIALGYIITGLLAFLLGVCVTILLYRLRRRNERRHREEIEDGL